MGHIYSGLIVPLAILIPLFFAFLKYRSIQAEGKIILIYLLFGAIGNTVAKILAYNKVNNLPVLHLYTCLEFLIITVFFRITITEKKRSLILDILEDAFVIACVGNALFLQSIFTFNSYTLSLSALIIILLALNYYAKLFNSMQEVKVTSIPAFWFNTGLFLYFSGCFFLYIFSNFILQLSSHAFKVAWDIRASFLLVMYLLFALGFIKCKK